MAINDIVNNGSSEYDLTNGQYSPSQISQAYEFSQNANNVLGMMQTPTVDTSDVAQRAKLEKAKQTMQRGQEGGGLPFSPPSNGQMLEDMLGGLLLGYVAARALGGTGKQAIGVGLLAAGGNHDADRAEAQRFQTIKAMVASGENYSPDALFNFMKTGDDKALQDERHQNAEDKREDKKEAHDEKMEGMREAANLNLENQREASQERLQGMRDAAANERTASNNASRERAAALRNGGVGGNASGNGGFHLADGTPVQVIGKPVKQGSNVLVHVVKPDGSEELVNTDALQSTATPQARNQMEHLNSNIDAIINAPDSALHSFANHFGGGTNSPSWGSEVTSWASSDPQSRELFEKAKQIAGNRLLQNIAAAHAAGASGINTKGELDAYNQNLPELDFSSPAALKASMKEYKSYVNGGYMDSSDYKNAAKNDPMYNSDSTASTVNFNDLK
ncbi:hypothetical protein ACVTW2_000679 [Escherichia coli]